MAQWVYDTGLTEFSNLVKENLLSELDRHGFLRVPAEKINQEIAVVIHKPSTFGATLRKWFGVDDKTHKISIIRILGASEPERKKNVGGGVVSLAVHKKEE